MAIVYSRPDASPEEYAEDLRWLEEQAAQEREEHEAACRVASALHQLLATHPSITARVMTLSHAAAINAARDALDAFAATCGWRRPQ